ncbi:hypothetical protein NEOKW01_2003 [Nematocida sp. AWRm80]|nr:hypothetical protein NEOKW01_2003 [Nematocida sp. AWRm80]
MNVREIWPRPPMEEFIDGKTTPPTPPEKLVMFNREIQMYNSKPKIDASLLSLVNKLIDEFNRVIDSSVDIYKIRNIEDDVTRIEDIYKNINAKIEEYRREEALERLKLLLKEQIQHKEEEIRRISLKSKKSI